LARRGTEAPQGAGDDGGSALEWPDRVGAQAIRIGGGRVPRLAGLAAECWRLKASE
jgi:hypothetical protein